MNPARIPVITSAAERPRQGSEGGALGGFTWFTLIDSALTPTTGLSIGVAELAPGQASRAHWHTQQEVYHILQGHGVMEIDGTAHTIERGSTIYVPGDALHSVRNDAEETMRIFYAFPANSLGEVEYKFPNGEATHL